MQKMSSEDIKDLNPT
jgi:hypothetical protein